MRVTQAPTSRASYYDRNPLEIQQTFAFTGFAPHAITTRWTYTVPAARKALVDAVSGSLAVDAVATTRVIVQLYIDLDPAGTNTSIVAMQEENQNTVGIIARAFLAPQMLLTAGRIISMQTADNSTGGTIRYQGAMHATEFDA
jgi:hypothetical protein